MFTPVSNAPLALDRLQGVDTRAISDLCEALEDKEIDGQDLLNLDEQKARGPASSVSHAPRARAAGVRARLVLWPASLARYRPFAATSTHPRGQRRQRRQRRRESPSTGESTCYSYPASNIRPGPHLTRS